MNLIQQQWARMQQQFAALTATQKMLAMSLTALMVVTVLFWGKYAATADTVEVLSQSFSTDQGNKIIDRLKQEGITARQGSDGRIMVPESSRTPALAIIGCQRALSLARKVVSAGPVSASGRAVTASSRAA